MCFLSLDNEVEAPCDRDITQTIICPLTLGLLSWNEQFLYNCAFSKLVTNPILTHIKTDCKPVSNISFLSDTSLVNTKFTERVLFFTSDW